VLLVMMLLMFFETGTVVVAVEHFFSWVCH
jgi:hypothetical protein